MRCPNVLYQDLSLILKMIIFILIFYLFFEGNSFLKKVGYLLLLRYFYTFQGKKEDFMWFCFGTNNLWPWITDLTQTHLSRCQLVNICSNLSKIYHTLSGRPEENIIQIKYSKVSNIVGVSLSQVARSTLI